MARGERELRVTIVGDDKSGSKALKGLGDQVDSTEGKVSKFSSFASSAFGKVALAAGGLFAGQKLVQFAGDMQGLGVELDTMGKKAATVFEGATGDVTNWAKANASAFGLTDDKLRSLAANFGDLLKPMGFTANQAADMSTKVVGLSGALSAWSGGTRTAADVSEILAKAMLGEREGLKGLGISITEAEVKGRLLEKGQKDLTGAALQQAQALATQELIFEKSADAQAAWADGSMDAVKKQNALKEKVAELREDIAMKLAPVFAGLVTFLVDTFIPGAERVAAVLGPVLAAAFTGLAETVPVVTGVFDGLVGVLGNPVFQVVAGIIATLFVPALIQMGAQATIAAAQVVAAWVTTQASAIAATATSIVQFAVQGAKWVWLGVTSLASAAKVAAAWLIAMGPIALVVAAVVAAAVLIVKNWDWIKQTAGDVVSAIGGFLSWLIGRLVNFVQEWGVLLLGPIGAVWKFRDEISGVVRAVIGFFGRMASAVGEAVGEAVGWVAGMPGRALRALGNLGSYLYSAGADLIWGMVRGIASMAGRLADAAINVVRSAVNAAKRFLGIGSPSKLFEGFGIDVGEGFVRGLHKSEGDVARASERLVAAAGGGYYGVNDPLWQPGMPPVDSFEWNDMHDPNRGKPGYFQNEDGSWSPDPLYKGGNTYRNWLGQTQPAFSGGYMHFRSATHGDYYSKKAGFIEDVHGNLVPYGSASDPLVGGSAGGGITINVFAANPKDAALAVRDELLRYQRRVTGLGWQVA